MKVLKPIISGLIVHEGFDDVISDVLNVNATLTQGSSYVEFVNGSISLNASSYTNMVFEVENSFVPTVEGDMGGIKIQRGDDVKELYEYYDPDNDMGTLPYVKLVKKGNRFTGYGSNDGITWIDRGGVSMQYIESVSVAAVGESLYRLESIKAYKDTEITIHSILPDWNVEIYKEGQLVSSKVSEGDNVKIELPTYPYTCTVQIYDELNDLVCDYILTDVWGGDEYSCSANVEIYNESDISIEDLEGKDLGKMADGKIEAKFRIHNNDAGTVVHGLTIRVADYSPFGEWVQLANDVDGIPDTFSDSISMDLGAEDMYFWIYISRPSVIDTNFDYSRNECIFYLEVL